MLNYQKLTVTGGVKRNTLWVLKVGSDEFQSYLSDHSSKEGMCLILTLALKVAELV